MTGLLLNLRGIYNKPVGAAPVFSPLDLFSSGEEGAWYDPSDTSTVWATTTATIQTVAASAGVTATAGNLVAQIDDKSGNGNHATQATVAARPVLRQSGGLYYLEFDGTDDIMITPNTTDGAVGSDNTGVFGVQIYDGRNYPFVFGGRSSKGFNMLTSQFTEQIRVYVDTASGDALGNGTTSFTDTDFIYSADWDRSAGAVRGWANQNLEVNVTATPADKTESTTCGLGVGFNSSTDIIGRIYNGVIIDRKLSDTDRNTLESYIAGKTGVTL